MSPSHDLVLTPRDGLFAKDGRGWYTAGAGRAYAFDVPPPSTVVGALCTACGRAQEAGQTPLTTDQWQALRGSLQLKALLLLSVPHASTPGPNHRLWPAPADALYLEQQPRVHRLLPKPPAGAAARTLGSDDDPAREALRWPALDDQSKPEPAPNWWCDADFVAWLRGDAVDKQTDRQAWPDPTDRRDAHVVIDPETLAALDGGLYSHDVIEVVGRSNRYALACRAELPASLAQHTVTLGGRRRLCGCEAAEESLFAMPDLLRQAVQDGVSGLRLVVVTPACFQHGWLPDGLERRDDRFRGRLGLDPFPEVTLRAAFVGRPRHVSGWDMAAGAPKPTLRLVPPGAVYFVQRTDGQPFGADQVSQLWLAQLGQHTDDGLGLIVPGVWTPENEENQG